jgi:cytochrome c oxidase cbb3-type subunit III
MIPKFVTRPRRSKRALGRLALLLVPALCWSSLSITQQREKEKGSAPAGRARASPPAEGRHAFESRCAGCHGLDGRGGEHAPNISTDVVVQRLSNQEVTKIIHSGIPAKGMPAFDYLSVAETSSIVSYLRALGRGTASMTRRGNPLLGQELFFGKAGCGQCHMIVGKGGFLGPDLTEYGRTHAPDELKQIILNLAKAHDASMVEIVTCQGERFSGVVRNEDNFSVQVLDTDGVLHLLMKAEVEQLNRTGGHLMPDDYRPRLSTSELEDLISYLGQAAHGTARESATAMHDHHPKVTPVRRPQQ